MRRTIQTHLLVFEEGLALLVELFDFGVQIRIAQCLVGAFRSLNCFRRSGLLLLGCFGRCGRRYAATGLLGLHRLVVVVFVVQFLPRGLLAALRELPD